MTHEWHECAVCFRSKPVCDFPEVPCAHTKQFCQECVAKISTRKCPYRCAEPWPASVQEEAVLATLLRNLATVNAATEGAVAELKMRGWWAEDANQPQPPPEFAHEVERRDDEWVLREGGQCGPPTRFISLANALRKSDGLVKSMQHGIDVLLATVSVPTTH